MPVLAVSTVTVAKPPAKSIVAFATGRPSAVFSWVLNRSVPGGAAVPEGDAEVVWFLDSLLVVQAPSIATGATRRTAAAFMGVDMWPRIPRATIIKRVDTVWRMPPIQDIPLTTIDGDPIALSQFADRAVLVVNVASKCGLTPQYTGLEKLARDYADRGLTVIGVPCNQFMGQEPGSADEIKTFCSTTYGVTFPLLEKTDVNGAARHPLYAELTKTPDADGAAGDIQWNFEKFLLAPGGQVVNRFRPRTEPEAPEVIAAIEAVVPR
jgi:glutathione peroxidase